MKNNRLFKSIPTKLTLLVAAFLLIAFFSNDFGLVDIQKTAIILAVGVDSAEEGFCVTSEIAVPKGSDRSTGGTSSVVVSCYGQTVSDCISQIYTKTGWVPKLVFCDLLLIGEQTAKQSVMPILDYFLRNEYVSDNCKLAVCKGRAEETLSSQSAVDDTSSLAIEKLFSSAAEKAGRVKTATLREFAILAFGVGKSGAMPYLTMQEQKGSEENQAKPTSASEQPPKEKIYQAAQTALFSHGKMVEILTEEETFCYRLLQGEVKMGFILSQEKESPVALTVLKNSGDVRLNMKGKPYVEAKISATVRVSDKDESTPVEDWTRSKPSPETLSFAEEKMRATALSLWMKSKQSGCDLFDLKTKLYRSSKQKFEEWKDTLFSVMSIHLNVQINPIK